MMGIPFQEMDVIIVNYKMDICAKIWLDSHHNALSVEIIVMNVIIS